MTTYGLHPSLWRKIRDNHSGGVKVNITNKKGDILGKCVVSRYESLIHLEENINFKSISFDNLIKDTQDIFLSPQLKDNHIAIGVSHFG
jgi:hypothetical protein